MPVDDTLCILFTDMWDQFNESHNVFILALQNALKSTQTRVIGYSNDTIGAQKPDLVVFGPFGESWKSLPKSWPKVHYTGENTRPIIEDSVKLNIGYELPPMSDDSYLRIPLWQLEIDWFGADLVKLRNPLPLPIDACTTTTANLDSRTKFCAFIVTNPKNKIRNDAFKTLTAYKPVDSAGRLFNNVGDSIFAGLGGGGGELKKHEFLKEYKFSITYENVSNPGYTTEKLLHAKAAGCVPIYWGDPKVGRDFNEKGFINAINCKCPQDLVNLVEKMDNDPVQWLAAASVPALSTYSRDLVRRNLAEMVRRFLVIANRGDLVASIPPFLGAKTSAEADELRKQRLVATVVTVATVPVNLVFVTGVTKRFWPSLSHWITYTNKIEFIKQRVYVGSDVSDLEIESIQKTSKSVEFVRFPSIVPHNFPDFWDPQHYAWKLWIYNTVVNDPMLKGKIVFYMDAGSVLLRLPTEWLQQVRSTGVSFLEDCRQKNRNWCHSTFCEKLQVTEQEKESQQIAACLMLFVAGHPVPTKLFADAYALGQQRDIVTGMKWEGMGSDGKPFGHRHDQSILSILSKRQGCATFPIDKVYGDSSVRSTLDAGQAVYVHRGAFIGIDETYIINLDRRQDRMKTFVESNSLQGVNRLAAFDGITLTLTPSLARLFKTNDFFWKKAVMGCALSHLKLWTTLVNSPPEINTFLILEDDARLKPEWRSVWATAYQNLPEDWDCVYLGGVLPPNRGVFVSTLERVAPGLARVKTNKIFGQAIENRYFHFCAYAYVLSRRGAMKILQSIRDRDGYWTSADHMICNRVDTMNIYVLDPLVAGASQDDDPAYKTAAFNDFSRVDSFDSDLWNNDKRFSKEEITGHLAKEAPLNANAVFSELSGNPIVMPKNDVPRFITLNTCMDGTQLYELNWLQDLFQTTRVIIEPVSKTERFTSTDDITVVLIKPNWKEQLEWLEHLRAHTTFKILHLSDEYGTDPIYMYEWPEVKGVLRFYARPGLDPKTLVIPLGYHWQFRGNRDVPHLSTPNLPFRENMWSFAGTDWVNRSNEMASLNVIQPHFVKWFREWRDPQQLKEEEYLALLLNSKFVPCPRGQNVETFRFYEALDCGCIPLFIDSPDNEAWLRIFNNEIPFLKLQNWEHAAALLQHFQKNLEQMEQYRTAVLISWAKYKMGLKEKVRVWSKN